MMPAPHLRGQLSTLLMPHTQAHVPLKSGFGKAPQAPSPASPQTQHGFSLLSPGRSHLCSKAGWSSLHGVGWKMGQPSSNIFQPSSKQQISTANQRWRKAHQNQGSAFTVSGSGPAESHFTQQHTQKHNRIINCFHPQWPSPCLNYSSTQA